jgi:hypothetical protein
LKREISFLSSDREKRSEELRRYEGEERELSELAERHRDFIVRIKAVRDLVGKEKELPKLKLCEDLESKLLALEEEELQLVGRNSEKQVSLKEGREKMDIFETKTK